MRRTLLILTSTLFAVFALVLAGVRLSNSVFTPHIVHAKENGKGNQATPVKVVILRCNLAAPGYSVHAFSASTGSPTTTPGAACGPALADQLNAGFEIHNVQTDGSSLVYTLASQPDGGDSNSNSNN